MHGMYREPRIVIRRRATFTPSTPVEVSAPRPGLPPPYPTASDSKDPAPTPSDLDLDPRDPRSVSPLGCQVASPPTGSTGRTAVVPREATTELKGGRQREGPLDPRAARERPLDPSDLDVKARPVGARATARIWLECGPTSGRLFWSGPAEGSAICGKREEGFEPGQAEGSAICGKPRRRAEGRL